MKRTYPKKQYIERYEHGTIIYSFQTNYVDDCDNPNVVNNISYDIDVVIDDAEAETYYRNFAEENGYVCSYNAYGEYINLFYGIDDFIKAHKQPLMPVIDEDEVTKDNLRELLKKLDTLREYIIEYINSEEE